MSFFLLGKTSEGTLNLLSDAAFSTRQDALAELSRLTASPKFDSWDDEVLVLDLDSGTPVLLVRPAPEQSPVGGDSSEDDESFTKAETDPDDSSSFVDDPALAAVLLDLEEADGSQAVDDASHTTDEPEDQSTAEAEDSEGAEDAFVGEAEDEPVVEVDEAWAAAVAESEEPSDTSLKDALVRTAAQMEAQGISAPASVGPAAASEAEEAGDETIALVSEEGPEPLVSEKADDNALDADDAADASSPDEASALDREDIEPPSVEEAPESEATDEAAEELESEIGTDDPGIDTLDTAEETEPTVMPPVWPWDSAASQPDSSSLAGLEEPGSDTESMIRALADDDASRTVVLGEYDSTPPQAQLEPEGMSPALPEDGSLTASEPDPVPTDAAKVAPEFQPDATAAIEPAAAEPVAAPIQPEPVSDFVELGEVPAMPAQAYEPGRPDIEGMTCSDCVFLETCPNKGERQPATCGSFQWK